MRSAAAELIIPLPGYGVTARRRRNHAECNADIREGAARLDSKKRARCRFQGRHVTSRGSSHCANKSVSPGGPRGGVRRDSGEDRARRAEGVRDHPRMSALLPMFVMCPDGFNPRRQRGGQMVHVVTCVMVRVVNGRRDCAIDPRVRLFTRRHR